MSELDFMMDELRGLGFTELAEYDNADWVEGILNCLLHYHLGYPLDIDVLITMVERDQDDKAN